MADFIEFQDVCRHYGPVRALDGVSLGVRKGEFFSVLGPSGCGKTTLLRILAGFERPDRGRVLLDGVDITELPRNHRKVNTIFQNYALFPHLTVRQNIAFGRMLAKRPKAEIDADVERMLALIRMEDQSHKRPDQISGGQKQRVAIARALINKPQVLLLDEPLAALDLKLRQRMLMELDLVHDQVGLTFIFVTHDQNEAMSVSDRVAVMRNGRIEQLGTPAEIYEAPRTSFVAACIGDSNFFEGTVLKCWARITCGCASTVSRTCRPRTTASCTMATSCTSACDARSSTSHASRPPRRRSATGCRLGRTTSSTWGRTLASGCRPKGTVCR